MEIYLDMMRSSRQEEMNILTIIRLVFKKNELMTIFGF